MMNLFYLLLKPPQRPVLLQLPLQAEIAAMEIARMLGFIARMMERLAFII